MYDKKTKIFILLVCLFFIAATNAYDYDPNDFVTEVVSYDSTGTSTYNYPEDALGRPAIDTDYLDVLRPVVPVYQVWGTATSDQVVTIGYGGHLIVKFNHKVADDKNNPHGIDFIIFGNAIELIGADWQYTDPNDVIINGDAFGNYILKEPGIVSVSQDGIDWYTFNDGPYADDFAPTIGRVYDTNDPQGEYVGEWTNLWWGQVTNPTLPIDPNLTAEDFEGKTVAYLCQAYGNSAGGTGFDLKNLASEDYQALRIDPATGRRWIQYVKIENMDTYNIEKPEVDAIADVAACGDYKHPYPPGDINQDCSVDFRDFAIMTANWLQCTWNGE
ncbi:MAG: hypothetical protein ACYSRR_04045 [Planctomycetota bacterium]|jgi:hypothetical protein